MSIIRVSHDKNNPYVLINKKTLEIPDLSWEAKGVWSYLISKPDNWNVCVKHLIKTFGAKKYKIYRMLNELIEFKLCKRSQNRIKGEDGKMNSGSVEYIIFEVPYETKNRLPNFQEAAFQEAKKRDALISNDIITNKEEERISRNSKSSDDTLISKAEKIIEEIKEDIKSSASRLCEILRKRINSHGVKFKDPKSSKTLWNSWIESMDKILNIDSYSEKEVEEIINFAHDDDFWCQNILSPSKLREKMSRLALQKTKNLSPEEKKKKTMDSNKNLFCSVVNEIYKNNDPGPYKFSLGTEYLQIGRSDHPHVYTLSYFEKGFADQLDGILRKINKEKYLVSICKNL